MAKGKDSNSGKGGIGSIIFMIIGLAILYAFFTSKGVSLVNLINTARYHGNELGPKLVQCAIGNNCELSSNYVVTSSGSKPATSSNTTSSNNNSSNETPSNSVASSSTEESNATNNSKTSTSNNKTVKSIESLSSVVGTNMTKDEAMQMLNSITIVKNYDTVKYKRTEWKHWIVQKEFSNCSGWSTRDEVLDRQAVKGSVVYLDSKDKETKNKKDACNIKSGKWIDPYSSEVLTDPSGLDIDHTGALSWAAKAGGQIWNKQAKQDFANDFDHLVATTAKQNRTKGDKGPSEWMPENTKAHCDYSKIYVYTVNKYKLNLTQADKTALEKGLNSCAA